ncbi:uncharacterized protein LOC134208087 isoform X2 [Armigeres subalbatus]|uniref:uncharacterized protein LOC134208087 isoform X2 n=1 Tax=Armigeres subalbatus TaxID=124917 RepID=UPI002ED3159F
MESEHFTEIRSLERFLIICPPHCKPHTFSSIQMRNGSIAPSHKRSGVFPSATCELYEFVGQGVERIQIVFSEFRLPSKLEPNECGETDILMLEIYTPSATPQQAAVVS